ncbi:MAG TPA: hypothetical protein DCE80_10810 [Ignavibacteriales bacterium]|nr:hypothetical protein [Ignavibacteriales bacterium]
MTLLEEIQNAATDTNSDLGTLLRKCKILAARIDSKPLEDWLFWESNGYPENIKVPEYRIWQLEVKGHFSGPFGSGIRNAQIPLAFLPEKSREQYEHYECRQSIASLETILTKTDTGVLQISTGDLSLILGTKVYQNQHCIQAWAEVGTGQLVELLNSVRNRILDFALAVWKEQPTTGEPNGKKTGAVESARIIQIFNTTISGGSANLVGTMNNSTVNFNVTLGDFSSLERLLQEHNVLKDDIGELKVCLDSEKQLSSNKGFGPKVSSWIGKMIKKSAEGSWDVSIKVAANLLSQTIMKYYGL